MTILRRIYGPIQDKRGCRPRWHSEFDNLYKDLNVADDTTIRSLGWVCHITSMEDERIPKKVLIGKFHTTRPVGKPRWRREDVVQRDTPQILGIMGWRRQRRKEASSEGNPGPRRGCSAIYGMKQRSLYFVPLHLRTATECLIPACIYTF
jgi:hypothetical protein